MVTPGPAQTGVQCKEGHGEAAVSGEESGIPTGSQAPLPYNFFFFFNKFYLFIYFWLCWVFVAVRGLSLVVVSGGYSSLQCAGFSLQWLLLLRSTGSRRAGFSSCGFRALEHSLSSCGARA